MFQMQEGGRGEQQRRGAWGRSGSGSGSANSEQLGQAGNVQNGAKEKRV